MLNKTMVCRVIVFQVGLVLVTENDSANNKRNVY